VAVLVLNAFIVLSSIHSAVPLLVGIPFGMVLAYFWEKMLRRILK